MSNVQVRNLVLNAESDNILSQRIKLSELRWLGRVAYGKHLSTLPSPISS